MKRFLSFFLMIGSALAQGTIQGNQVVITGSGTILVFVATTIVVSPLTAGVVISGTVQYSADFQDNSGNHTPACTSSGWASSNTGVATINASTGLATGVSTGTATITCTASGITGSATLTVETAPAFLNPPGSCSQPCSLGAGTVGQPYINTFTATGGTPPYVFSLISGTIPAGLNPLTAGGVLLGTPTTAGTSTFTVQVCDSLGLCSPTLQLSLLINASANSVQLPAVWVNNLEYVGTTSNTINFPASGIGGSWTCPGFSTFGPYNATNPGVSCQQAITDAESCRINGTGHPGTHILYPGTLCSTVNGLLLRQTAGDLISYSNFIFLDSATPYVPAMGSGYTVAAGLATTGGSGTGATVNITSVASNGGITGVTVGSGGSGYLQGDILGVTQGGAVNGYLAVDAVSSGAITSIVVLASPPCSRGIQDNVLLSKQPGLRNVLCDGTQVSYQLGTTVTPVSGAVTLANGTTTNTSNYNDRANMWHVTCTANNCTALGNDPADSNGQGIHHYAIGNLEVYPKPGATSVVAPFGLNFTAPSATSVIPSHIHIFNSFIHGDWQDAPVSGGVATGPPAGGANILANMISWSGGCVYCSVMYNYVDQSLRPSGEGHILGFMWVQQTKIAHNWFEGNGIGLLCGGPGNNLTLISSGFVVCQDMEDRSNRYTYPYSWLLAKQAGFVPALGNYVRKNAHEYKFGERIVLDGNIFEHVDNSGAQSGIIISFKTAQTSTGFGNNYQTTLDNVTVTNNIMRDSCNGIRAGYRSTISAGNGGGVSFPAHIMLFQNNLLDNIALSNPGCAGSNPQNTSTIENYATSNWNATASENAAGTVATFTLTSKPGGTQSMIQVGDPVIITGCTTTAFNTGTPIIKAFGPLAITGTNGTLVNGLTVVINLTATPNITDTTGTCLVTMGQGYPDLMTFNHESDIVTPTGGSDPGFTYQNGGSVSWPLSRSFTYTNSISYANGFNAPQFGEGTRSETSMVDPATEVYNNNVLIGRDSLVSCPGHTSGSPGGIAKCYTEYSSSHVAITPPVTLYGTPTINCTTSDPTVGSCLGMVGLMNTSTVTLPLSDWHNYRLCTAADAACNFKASFFAAGQTFQAADGTDMGVNVTAIDNAQISNQYCPSCGSFPDH